MQLSQLLQHHQQLILSVIMLLLLLSLIAQCSLAYEISPLGGLPVYDPNNGDSQDMEFRVAIESGRVECFYQDVKRDHNLEVSYQVTETSSRFEWMQPGGYRDLSIDFFIRGPNGAEMLRDVRKSDGTTTHLIKEQGVYAICFDNSYSSSGTKLVNVEIFVYANEDEDRWGTFDSDFTFSPEDQYEDSVDQIKTSINKVRDDLTRISHEQEQRRAIESRDRNVAEQNYDYVNRFSMASIAVMFFVGLLQLYMIRSFFDDKNYLRKVFKAGNNFKIAS